MTGVDEEAASIGIRPEVTILSVLRHLNYKPWFAIAEFIDNALQSATANHTALSHAHGGKYQLVVDVRIDSSNAGRIVVEDNAAGIASADFPRAFRAAQVPDDRTGLSEFGMGMKSAACWFAQVWSVRTKALNEAVERTIRFDMEKIVESKIERLESEIRAVDPAAHYTTVTLHGLHHMPQGRTIGKIKEHLSSIYRNFIRDGRMVLQFNGDRLSYNTPDVLEAVTYVAPGVPDPAGTAPILWRKDVDLDFGSGQRVRGFAGLRKVGSTQFAGFALFRRGRLVMGSHDETYRPSYVFKQANSYLFQRLFGELHVEGFDVSHTKDGFRWEEHEDIFLECLKEQLERAPIDLLSQADNFRSLPAKKSIQAQADSATETVVDHIKTEIEPLLIEAQEHPAVGPPIPTTLVPSELLASERAVSVNDGRYTWEIVVRVSLDPAREDWIKLARADPQTGDESFVRRLFVDLSLAHPFSVEFVGAHAENIELFLRVATLICIALVLSEDATGESPDTMLFNLNYLLRGAMLRSKV